MSILKILGKEDKNRWFSNQILKIGMSEIKTGL